MAKYELLISRSAEKTLKAIPGHDSAKLVAAIGKLVIDPRPQGCRKLFGEMNTYRIRVGVYRIIYEIEDRLLRILVLKIGHRKNVYR
jgi:mRNA interferase RelE/StbE